MSYKNRCENLNCIRDEHSFKKMLESWELSSYNEGTPEQLDYYINERKADVGDIAYQYSQEEENWFRMKILNVIRRSDDPKKYDKLLENEDVLLDGEDEYEADTSAEFITDNDCYLVWFRFCERPNWTLFSEEGPWDDNPVAVITKDGTHDIACYKALDENDAVWLTLEGKPFNHEVVKWHELCNLQPPCECNDIPSKLRRIAHEEFENLKPGDAVFINVGNEMYPAEVLGEPFYNCDAGKPDWEVETDNGFCDESSLYILFHNSGETEDESFVEEYLDLLESVIEHSHNKFRVKIPGGYLMVEEKGSESEYPGVYISFSEDGESYENSDLIACVECDSSSQEIQTVVYRKDCDEPNSIIYYEDGSEV